MLQMKLDANDFELFGLPERQALDSAELAARWKALQGEVHPDRFAAEGAAAQRRAMQWAVRVNEGYQRLKDPLKRAALLCELHGAKVDAENNTAMPSAFLVQQMAWREALEKADGAEAVQALADEVAERRMQMLAELGALLDRDQRWAEAAQQLRALMFVERFAEDVDGRLEALGH